MIPLFSVAECLFWILEELLNLILHRIYCNKEACFMKWHHKLEYTKKQLTFYENCAYFFLFVNFVKSSDEE